MRNFIGLRIGQKRIEAAAVKTGREPKFTEYLVYDYTNKESMVNGLREIAGKLAEIQADWAVGLPSGEFSFRRLSFPFKNRRAIASALPFELEGLLPYSSESFISSHLVLSASGDHAEVLACAIKKERLRFYTDALREAGIEPQLITPEVEALSFLLGNIIPGQSGRTVALIADVDDDAMLMCYVGENGSLDYHSTEPAEEELEKFLAAFEKKPVSIYIGGRGSRSLAAGSREDAWKHELRASFGGPVEPDRAMIPLGLALRGAAGEKQGLNFSREEPLYGKLRAGFRFAAVGMALFLALSVGFLFYRNHVKAETLRETKAEIGRVFKAAIPSGRIVKPNFQLKQRLKELKAALEHAGIGQTGRRDLLWVLKSLSERLTSVRETKLEEIIYEERMVTIKGKTGDFKSVNRIRDILNSMPVFKSVEVADSRAFAETKKVSFKMRLEL